MPDALPDGLFYHRWWEVYESVHALRLQMLGSQEVGEWRARHLSADVSPRTHLSLMRDTPGAYVKPNSTMYSRCPRRPNDVWSHIPPSHATSGPTSFMCVD